MFHNLLMTGLTPLASTDEIHGWENRPFTAVWPEPPPYKAKDSEIKRTIKKKPKRVRTAYTTEQLRALENSFSKSKYIDKNSRRELADMIKINEKSIKIWFQNRRMKEKKDTSESSYDSSSESFTNSVSPALNSPVEIKEECLPKEPLSENNHVSHYEVPQYQYPGYVGYAPTEYQNQVCQEIPLPPSVTFSYDRNVYPTQYYPPAEVDTNVGSQYFQGNEFTWAPNTFDTSYFN